MLKEPSGSFFVFTKKLSKIITHIGKMVYFGPPLIDKMLSMSTHFMNNVGIADGSQKISYL
jgi:hypothetical protein